MITAITIENFKGIREKVELELAPLSFLFGANSAGKSSVTDAMEYLRAILETQSAMPELYSSTWQRGFLSLVHDHDTSRTITIGVTCELTSDDLGYFAIRGHASSEDSHSWSAPVTFSSVFYDAPSPLSLELRLKHQTGQFLETLTSGAVIDGLRISISGDELVSIVPIGMRSKGRGKKHLQDFLWRVNLNHDLLIEDRSSRDPLQLDFRCATRCILPNSGDPPLSQDYYESIDEGGLVPNDAVANKLNALVCGACQLVQNRLKRFRKIGALRSVPLRNAIRSPNMRTEDWENGIAAWDDLAFCGEDHLSDINTWLHQLGVKHMIVQTRLVDPNTVKNQPAAEPTDEYSRFLLDHVFDQQRQIHFVRASNEEQGFGNVYRPPVVSARLSPDQLGTGISQLVPVIVAARDDASLQWSIMQPELHLHPRIQAELGDLFIDSYHSFGNRFLIETHSENLLLRCLRRIRETHRTRVPEGLSLRTDEIAIYFVQQVDGVTTFQRIEVDIQGDFIQPWPDDFFEVDFYERFATGEDR